MPGIFVEHQAPSKEMQEESKKKAEEKPRQLGLQPEPTRTRRRSQIVQTVPMQVMMIKKREQQQAKPKQLLKQYSTVSVFDGRNYALNKTDEQPNAEEAENGTCLRVSKITE